MEFPLSLYFVYGSSKETIYRVLNACLTYVFSLLSKMSAAADVAAVEQTMSEMLFHTESRLTKDSD